MSEFVNGARTFSGLDTGMCGNSCDLYFVNADAFARSLNRSFEPLPRFQNENSLRLQRETLGNGSRRMTANLFVRDKQHAYWRMWNVVLTQQSKRMHSDGDAGFHVEYTRSPHSAVVDTKWHLFESPEFPNGIGVAEEQHRLALGYSNKLSLYMVP